ncbi:hypothetical protein ACFX13_033715 [Malus domestica]
MKSRKISHSMAPSLPDEIKLDILSRLPVKSLMRFRCVCKPWLHVISNPQFVAQHQRNTVVTSTSKNNFKLFVAKMSDDHLDLLSIDYNDDVVSTRVLNYPSVIKPDMVIDILGSCNGLVCLEIDFGEFPYNIILWNPSTGDTNVLPEPPYVDRNKIFYGLGYDSSAEDYKLILGSRDSTTSTEEPFRSMIHVFTVKSNSWRTCRGLYYLEKNDQRGCFLNGALHWIQLQRRSSKIVSFDLAEENFKSTLSLPQRDDRDIFVGIGTSQDCLFVYTSALQDKTFSIWIMKEYGVKESWTRVAKISSTRLARQIFVDFCDLTVMPVCIFESGEVLLDHEGRILVIYNPRQKTYRIIIEADDENDVEAVTYPETLDLPGGGAYM